MGLVGLRLDLMTDHPPSVLWHCWLGHMTCKNIVPEWPKPYSTQLNPSGGGITHNRGNKMEWCQIRASHLLMWFFLLSHLSHSPSFLPGFCIIMHQYKIILLVTQTKGYEQHAQGCYTAVPQLGIIMPITHKKLSYRRDSVRCGNCNLPITIVPSCHQM